MVIANLNALLLDGAPSGSENAEPLDGVAPVFLEDWKTPGDEDWTLPGITEKYGEVSLTSPRSFSGEPLAAVPDVVLLAYTNFAEQGIDALADSTEVTSFPGLYLAQGGRVGVLKNYNPGAPMAVIQVERLVALGVRSFVIVGIAGGLWRNSQIGDVYIAERAVRDEGTSRHYMPPTRYAWPDLSLRKQVEQALVAAEVRARVSPTWTTDALFRETECEVAHYVSLGVATVEMEASAVFSVAKYRGIRAAALFVVSDLVRRAGWKRAATPVELTARVGQLIRVLSEHEWRLGERNG